MSRYRTASPTRPLAAGLIVAAAAAAILGAAVPAQAASQAATRTSARSTGLGATLYVAPSGQDTWSRASATVTPLGSIGRAIRLAQPGDRIVVRGGTYVEAAGYGAVPGRADAPIRLEAAAGQRVVLKGTLQLDGADYWRVRGINVTQDPHGARKEFLVKFDGGSGWRFTDAEVWGTRGVSNVMVSSLGSHGIASGYRITGNCIHDNDATGDAFMNDHEIYLMPGYRAGRGLISRNIFFNSENGAAIKAAGPSAATGASNVLIENNTIVRSAAGVIIANGSNRVTVRRNLIGDQIKRPPPGARWVQNYRAAVIGNHVSGAANQVSRNGVWGYPATLWTTPDSARIAHAGQARVRPAFNGTRSCSGFHPRNAVTTSYGRYTS